MAKKGHRYKKECVVCETPFTSKGARAKYCGDECRALASGEEPAGQKPAPKAGNAPGVRVPDEVDPGDVGAARELLEVAGFEVTEIKTPAGRFLFVGG